MKPVNSTSHSSLTVSYNMVEVGMMMIPLGGYLDLTPNEGVVNSGTDAAAMLRL